MSCCLGLIGRHFRKLHHKNEPFPFSGAFSRGLSKSWRSDTLNSGRVRSNQGFACSERCSNWEWRRTARMQQQEKKNKKRIRLDRAAEPSRTTESLQHLITPSTLPPLPAPPSTSICKTKMQKERRRALRLSFAQMPQGARSLCRALCAAPSVAASACNSSRGKNKIKPMTHPSAYNSPGYQKKITQACASVIFSLCTS